MIKLVSDRKLDQIKRAAEGATYGEWFYQESSHPCDEIKQPYDDRIISIVREDIDETTFIVAEHLEEGDAKYLVMVQPRQILDLIEYIKILEARLEFFIPVCSNL